MNLRLLFTFILLGWISLSYSLMAEPEDNGYAEYREIKEAEGETASLLAPMLCKIPKASKRQLEKISMEIGRMAQGVIGHYVSDQVSNNIEDGPMQYLIRHLYSLLDPSAQDNRWTSQFVFEAMVQSYLNLKSASKIDPIQALEQLPGYLMMLPNDFSEYMPYSDDRYSYPGMYHDMWKRQSKKGPGKVGQEKERYKDSTFDSDDQQWEQYSFEDDEFDMQDFVGKQREQFKDQEFDMKDFNSKDREQFNLNGQEFDIKDFNGKEREQFNLDGPAFSMNDKNGQNKFQASDFENSKLVLPMKNQGSKDEVDFERGRLEEVDEKNGKQNGPPAPRKMHLKEFDLMDEFERFFQRVDEMLPEVKEKRNHELCMDAVSFGILSYIGEGEYGKPIYSDFDQSGPYRNSGKGQVKLFDYLLGESWNDEINIIEELDSQNIVKTFRKIDSKYIEDPVLLDALKELVRDHGDDEEVIRFLQGKVSFTDFTKKNMIPISVYARLQKKSMNALSKNSIVYFLTEHNSKKSSHHDFEMLLTTFNLGKLEQALNEIKKNELMMPKMVAEAVIMLLVEEDGLDMDMACYLSYAVTMEMLNEIDENYLFQLLPCFVNNADKIGAHEQSAIARRCLYGFENYPLVEKILALESLAFAMPYEAFESLGSSDIHYLKDQGFFERINYFAKDAKCKGVIEMMFKKLDLKPATNTNQHFKKLGNSICNFDMKDHFSFFVWNATLDTEFGYYWTKECWPKKSQRSDELMKYLIREEIEKQCNVSEFLRNSSLTVGLVWSLSAFQPNHLQLIPESALMPWIEQISLDSSLSHSQNRVLRDLLENEMDIHDGETHEKEENEKDEMEDSEPSKFSGVVWKDVTCEDVKDILPHDLVPFGVAYVKSHFAKKELSPSIVNCLATKMYMRLQALDEGSHILNKEIQKIPGTFLLFFPKVTIANFGYLEGCQKILHNLQKADFDLLPPILHETVFGAIRTATFVCLVVKQHMAYERMKEVWFDDEYQGPGDKYEQVERYRRQAIRATASPSTGFPTSAPAAAYAYGESISWDSVSPIDTNVTDERDRISKIVGKIITPLRVSTSTDYDYMYGREYVRALGVYSCFMYEEFNDLSPGAFLEFARVAPKCIHLMSKKNVEAFRHAFFVFSFQYDLKDGDLKDIANILPLLSEFEIVNFFSRDMLLKTLPRLNSIEYEKQQWQQIEGDMTSRFFTVNDNLMLDLLDEFDIPLDLNYSPIDLKEVSVAVIAQLKQDFPRMNENIEKAVGGTTFDAIIEDIQRPIFRFLIGCTKLWGRFDSIRARINTLEQILAKMKHGHPDDSGNIVGIMQNVWQEEPRGVQDVLDVLEEMAYQARVVIESARYNEEYGEEELVELMVDTVLGELRSALEIVVASDPMFSIGDLEYIMEVVRDAVSDMLSGLDELMKRVESMEGERPSEVLRAIKDLIFPDVEAAMESIEDFGLPEMGGIARLIESVEYVADEFIDMVEFVEREEGVGDVIAAMMERIGPLVESVLKVMGDLFSQDKDHNDDGEWQGSIHQLTDRLSHLIETMEGSGDDSSEMADAIMRDVVPQLEEMVEAMESDGESAHELSNLLHLLRISANDSAGTMHKLRDLVHMISDDPEMGGDGDVERVLALLMRSLVPPVENAILLIHHNDKDGERSSDMDELLRMLDMLRMVMSDTDEWSKRAGSIVETMSNSLNVDTDNLNSMLDLLIESLLPQVRDVISMSRVYHDNDSGDYAKFDHLAMVASAFIDESAEAVDRLSILLDLIAENDEVHNDSHVDRVITAILQGFGLQLEQMIAMVENVSDEQVTLSLEAFHMARSSAVDSVQAFTIWLRLMEGVFVNDTESLSNVMTLMLNSFLPHLEDMLKMAQDVSYSGYGRMPFSGDYNTHHSGDYKMHHSGDYNMHHSGDYKMHHSGDYNMHHSGDYQMHHSGDYKMHHSGDYQMHHSGDYKMHHSGDYQMHHSGDYKMHHSGDYQIHHSGDYDMSHTNTYNLKDYDGYEAPQNGPSKTSYNEANRASRSHTGGHHGDSYSGYYSFPHDGNLSDLVDIVSVLTNDTMDGLERVAVLVNMLDSEDVMNSASVAWLLDLMLENFKNQVEEFEKGGNGQGLVVLLDALRGSMDDPTTGSLAKLTMLLHEARNGSLSEEDGVRQGLDMLVSGLLPQVEEVANSLKNFSGIKDLEVLSDLMDLMRSTLHEIYSDNDRFLTIFRLMDSGLLEDEGQFADMLTTLFENTIDRLKDAIGQGNDATEIHHLIAILKNLTQTDNVDMFETLVGMLKEDPRGALLDESLGSLVQQIGNMFWLLEERSSDRYDDSERLVDILETVMEESASGVSKFYSLITAINDGSMEESEGVKQAFHVALMFLDPHIKLLAGLSSNSDPHDDVHDDKDHHDDDHKDDGDKENELVMLVEFLKMTAEGSMETVDRLQALAQMVESGLMSDAETIDKLFNIMFETIVPQLEEILTTLSEMDSGSGGGDMGELEMFLDTITVIMKESLGGVERLARLSEAIEDGSNRDIDNLRELVDIMLENAIPLLHNTIEMLASQDDDEVDSLIDFIHLIKTVTNGSMAGVEQMHTLFDLAAERNSLSDGDIVDEMLSIMLDTFVPQIEQIFEKLDDGSDEDVQGLLDFIRMLKKILPGAVDGMADIIKSLMANDGESSKAVEGAFENIVPQIEQLLEDVGGGTSSEEGKVLNDVVEFIKKVTLSSTDVIDTLTLLFSGSSIEDVDNALKTSIETIFPKINELLTTVAGSSDEDLSELASFIETVRSSAYGAVEEAAPLIKLLEMVESGETEQSEVLSQMFKILLDGMVPQISSSLEMLFEIDSAEGEVLAVVNLVEPIVSRSVKGLDELMSIYGRLLSGEMEVSKGVNRMISIASESFVYEVKSFVSVMGNTSESEMSDLNSLLDLVKTTLNGSMGGVDRLIMLTDEMNAGLVGEGESVNRMLEIMLDSFCPQLEFLLDTLLNHTNDEEMGEMVKSIMSIKELVSEFRDEVARFMAIIDMVGNDNTAKLGSINDVLKLLIEGFIPQFETVLDEMGDNSTSEESEEIRMLINMIEKALSSSVEGIQRFFTLILKIEDGEQVSNQDIAYTIKAMLDTFYPQIENIFQMFTIDQEGDESDKEQTSLAVLLDIINATASPNATDHFFTMVTALNHSSTKTVAEAKRLFQTLVTGVVPQTQELIAVARHFESDQLVGFSEFVDSLESIARDAHNGVDALARVIEQMSELMFQGSFERAKSMRDVLSMLTDAYIRHTEDFLQLMSEDYGVILHQVRSHLGRVQQFKQMLYTELYEPVEREGVSVLDVFSNFWGMIDEGKIMTDGENFERSLAIMLNDFVPQLQGITELADRYHDGINHLTGFTDMLSSTLHDDMGDNLYQLEQIVAWIEASTDSSDHYRKYLADMLEGFSIQIENVFQLDPGFLEGTLDSLGSLLMMARKTNSDGVEQLKAIIVLVRDGSVGDDEVSILKSLAHQYVRETRENLFRDLERFMHNTESLHIMYDVLDFERQRGYLSGVDQFKGVLKGIHQVLIQDFENNPDAVALMISSITPQLESVVTVFESWKETEELDELKKVVHELAEVGEQERSQETYMELVENIRHVAHNDDHHSMASRIVRLILHEFLFQLRTVLTMRSKQPDSIAQLENLLAEMQASLQLISDSPPPSSHHQVSDEFLLSIMRSFVSQLEEGSQMMGHTNADMMNMVIKLLRESYHTSKMGVEELLDVVIDAKSLESPKTIAKLIKIVIHTSIPQIKDVLMTLDQYPMSEEANDLYVALNLIKFSSHKLATEIDETINLFEVVLSESFFNCHFLCNFHDALHVGIRIFEPVMKDAMAVLERSHRDDMSNLKTALLVFKETVYDMVRLMGSYKHDVLIICNSTSSADRQLKMTSVFLNLFADAVEKLSPKFEEIFAISELIARKLPEMDELMRVYDSIEHSVKSAHSYLLEEEDEYSPYNKLTRFLSTDFIPVIDDLWKTLQRISEQPEDPTTNIFHAFRSVFREEEMVDSNSSTWKHLFGFSHNSVAMQHASPSVWAILDFIVHHLIPESGSLWKELYDDAEFEMSLLESSISDPSEGLEKVVETIEMFESGYEYTSEVISQVTDGAAHMAAIGANISFNLKVLEDMLIMENSFVSHEWMQRVSEITHDFENIFNKTNFLVEKLMVFSPSTPHIVKPKPGSNYNKDPVGKLIGRMFSSTNNNGDALKMLFTIMKDYSVENITDILYWIESMDEKEFSDVLRMSDPHFQTVMSELKHLVEAHSTRSLVEMLHFLSAQTFEDVQAIEKMLRNNSYADVMAMQHIAGNYSMEEAAYTMHILQNRSADDVLAVGHMMENNSMSDMMHMMLAMSNYSAEQIENWAYQHSYNNSYNWASGIGSGDGSYHYGGDYGTGYNSHHYGGDYGTGYNSHHYGGDMGPSDNSHHYGGDMGPSDKSHHYGGDMGTGDNSHHYETLTGPNENSDHWKDMSGPDDYPLPDLVTWMSYYSMEDIMRMKHMVDEGSMEAIVDVWHVLENYDMDDVVGMLHMMDGHTIDEIINMLRMLEDHSVEHWMEEIHESDDEHTGYTVDFTQHRLVVNLVEFFNLVHHYNINDITRFFYLLGVDVSDRLSASSKLGGVVKLITTQYMPSLQNLKDMVEDILSELKQEIDFKDVKVVENLHHLQTILHVVEDSLSDGLEGLDSVVHFMTVLGDPVSQDEVYSETAAAIELTQYKSMLENNTRHHLTRMLDSMKKVNLDDMVEMMYYYDDGRNDSLYNDQAHNQSLAVMNLIHAMEQDSIRQLIFAAERMSQRSICHLGGDGAGLMIDSEFRLRHPPHMLEQFEFIWEMKEKMRDSNVLDFIHMMEDTSVDDLVHMQDLMHNKSFEGMMAMEQLMYSSAAEDLTNLIHMMENQSTDSVMDLVHLMDDDSAEDLLAFKHILDNSSLADIEAIIAMVGNSSEQDLKGFMHMMGTNSSLDEMMAIQGWMHNQSITAAREMEMWMQNQTMEMDWLAMNQSIEDVLDYPDQYLMLGALNSSSEMHNWLSNHSVEDIMQMDNWLQNRSVGNQSMTGVDMMQLMGNTSLEDLSGMVSFLQDLSEEELEALSHVMEKSDMDDMSGLMHLVGNKSSDQLDHLMHVLANNSLEEVEILKYLVAHNEIEDVEHALQFMMNGSADEMDEIVHLLANKTFDEIADTLRTMENLTLDDLDQVKNMSDDFLLDDIIERFQVDDTEAPELEDLVRLYHLRELGWLQEMVNDKDTCIDMLQVLLEGDMQVDHHAWMNVFDNLIAMLEGIDAIPMNHLNGMPELDLALRSLKESAPHHMIAMDGMVRMLEQRGRTNYVRDVMEVMGASVMRVADTLNRTLELLHAFSAEVEVGVEQMNATLQDRGSKPALSEKDGRRYLMHLIDAISGEVIPSVYNLWTFMEGFGPDLPEYLTDDDMTGEENLLSMMTKGRMYSFEAGSAGPLISQANSTNAINGTVYPLFPTMWSADTAANLYGAMMVEADELPTFHTDAHYLSFLSELGKYRGWSEDKLMALRGLRKVSFSKLSKESLMDLGHVTPLLSVEDLYQLSVLDLEVLEAFAYLDWNTSQKEAIVERYLQFNAISLGQLSVAEITSAGNLLCAIPSNNLSMIDEAALRDSLRFIGQLKCFSRDQLIAIKERVKALNESMFSKSMLKELGVIAGTFTADEFKQIKPIHSSLLSLNALRIASADDIKNGLSSSHYALMGMWNALAVASRTDVFKKLTQDKRNAVFEAASGLNTALFSAELEYYGQMEAFSSNEFRGWMVRALENSQFLFEKVAKGAKAGFKSSMSTSVYGMDDIKNVVKLIAPELKKGLEKAEFEENMDEEMFEERRFVEFLNEAAEDENIIDVLKGTKSLNDLHDSDIKNIPPVALEGLKNSQIRKLGAAAIASLFDSDLMSQDPTSFQKTLRKLTDEQFKDGLSAMSDKMNETSSANVLPWRPPLTIQTIIVKEFFRRMKQVDALEALEIFVDCMCPFVAGVLPYHINMIPPHAQHIDGMLNCFEESYEDLTAPVRNKLMRWVEETEEENMQLTRLGKFTLDMRLNALRNMLFNDAQKAVDFVEEGLVHDLDPLHDNHGGFIKILIKAIVKGRKEKFGEMDFIDNLGHGTCEIPLGRVRNFMNKEMVRHVAGFVLENCETKEDQLSESLGECTGEAASRLKRCQILLEKSNEVAARVEKEKKKPASRPSVDQFNMMRDLAETLFEDTDLSNISSSEMEKAAGALSGLKPTDLDKLPEEVVLKSLDTIKKNKNMSPRQKKIMLEKAKSAGLKIEGNTSISDLGELVSEVQPDEFKQISAESLVSGMDELKKKAASLSSLQKRAITEKLEEASLDEVLKENIGDFAQEISLDKLSEMSQVNMSLLKDQDWDRGQAAKLVEMMLNGTDGVLSTKDLSEMGSTLTGLKCSDVVSMYYDEMVQNTIVMSTVDLFPDMNECIQKKLHFSLQYMKGENYTMNGTDPELPELLESLPSNILLYYPSETADDLPNDLCLDFVRKVGRASFSKLSGDTEKMIRMRHGAKAISCLKRVYGEASFALNETLVADLGQLVCDVGADNLQTLNSAAFVNALPDLINCMDRFDQAYRNKAVKLAFDSFGDDTSQWDMSILDTLGPIVTLLDTSDIMKIESEAFLSSYDNMLPSEKGSDSTIINYEGFYRKAADAIQNRASSSRRKRTTSLTYDDFVILGPANSVWSSEELAAVPFEEVQNSLDVFGNVEVWTPQQSDAILNVLAMGMGQNLSAWNEGYVVQLKNILKHSNTSVLSSLPLTSAVASSLSAVSFNSEQREALYERYMEYNGKNATSLTSDDLVALGSLYCGAEPLTILDVDVDEISKAMKYLGEVTCFNQSQFDNLYLAIRSHNSDLLPDAALIQAMGTLAAGMPVEDWSSLPADSMPFVQSNVFELAEPERIRDGLTSDQIAASGVTNIGAIYNNEELFNSLEEDQKNALFLLTDTPLPEEETQEVETVRPVQNNNVVVAASTDDESGSSNLYLTGFHATCQVALIATAYFLVQ